eukprot:7472550-Heterocapsa_arctica.AAC.1
MATEAGVLNLGLLEAYMQKRLVTDKSRIMESTSVPCDPSGPTSGRGRRRPLRVCLFPCLYRVAPLGLVAAIIVKVYAPVVACVQFPTLDLQAATRQI